MPDEEVPREDELENRQGNLYPVGKALRRTFDAENHDSLGSDMTGLMLELARIDPDASPVPGRGAMPVASVAALASPAEIVSPPVRQPWWRGAVGRLLSR